eukprot:TRINITY_DN10845_c0_g1_i1.p1 TRINITY_DN10845_c0_g1~~TRINITY_DN10845_c0_g1_i1.p1  ORF type:complete len:287 (-),score=22.91 TRINITY_DN10845_c0_g1_i1:202-1062(-)
MKSSTSFERPNLVCVNISDPQVLLLLKINFRKMGCQASKVGNPQSAYKFSEALLLKFETTYTEHVDNFFMDVLECFNRLEIIRQAIIVSQDQLFSYSASENIRDAVRTILLITGNTSRGRRARFNANSDIPMLEFQREASHDEELEKIISCLNTYSALVLDKSSNLRSLEGKLLDISTKCKGLQRMIISELGSGLSQTIIKKALRAFDRNVAEIENGRKRLRLFAVSFHTQRVELLKVIKEIESETILDTTSETGRESHSPKIIKADSDERITQSHYLFFQRFNMS